MRLNPRFRWTLYVTFALMFVTGAGWLVADWQKAISPADTWQATAAWLLMLHGGGAMLALLLLGALIPLHSYRAWRAGKNRTSGSMMLTLNGLLVATSFGLYYVAAESVRPWMSNIHIVAGFCLPVCLLLHIALGRRNGV